MNLTALLICLIDMLWVPRRLWVLCACATRKVHRMIEPYRAPFLEATAPEVDRHNALDVRLFRHVTARFEDDVRAVAASSRDDAPG